MAPGPASAVTTACVVLFGGAWRFLGGGLKRNAPDISVTDSLVQDEFAGDAVSAPAELLRPVTDAVGLVDFDTYTTTNDAIVNDMTEESTAKLGAESGWFHVAQGYLLRFSTLGVITVATAAEITIGSSLLVACAIAAVLVDIALLRCVLSRCRRRYQRLRGMELGGVAVQGSESGPTTRQAHQDEDLCHDLGGMSSCQEQAADVALEKVQSPSSAANLTAQLFAETPVKGSSQELASLQPSPSLDDFANSLVASAVGAATARIAQEEAAAHAANAIGGSPACEQDIGITSDASPGLSVCWGSQRLSAELAAVMTGPQALEELAIGGVTPRASNSPVAAGHWHDWRGCDIKPCEHIPSCTPGRTPSHSPDALADYLPEPLLHAPSPLRSSNSVRRQRYCQSAVPHKERLTED